MTKPKRKDRGFEETLEQHGLIFGEDREDTIYTEHGLVRLVKRKQKYLRIENDEEEEE